MSDFLINDWSQGLISSDDDINGRKNGFLRMENVELDQNGAIVLTGGTVKLGSVFANTVHSIFSKFLGAGSPESPQYQYAADTSGNIFRSLPPSTQTNIGSGGSTTRAAFLAVLEYVLVASGNKRLRDDGSTVSNLGQGTASAPAVALNGAGNLTGAYQYAQVNVFVNASGGYQARSAPSSFVSITATANKIQVTPTNVSGVQNEVWIFRRGGTLDQFYRVARITSSYTTPFDDNLVDQDALNSGITLNLLALPIDSTNLPDAILEMVGPINGRILLFTAKTVHFTEVYSPESYVPSQSIFLMGAPQTAETFLWARKVANNVVLIGTTKDIYRLTGSFIEQSDGTLDVTIKPTGVDAPPISIDADIYQNNVVYMCAYGWVMCDQYGATTPLCPPNVDVNYYGKTRYGINGVPIFVTSTDKVYRYSCAVIRNKLFTIVPEGTAYPPTHRVDVYDFIRKHWRSIRYISNNAPLMLKSQEDHTVIGFFDNDKFIKRLDDQFTFTFDNGPAVNQTVTLLTPFYDCNMPRNRKDANTLKFKIDTGGNNIAATIYTDGNGASGTSIGNINHTGLSEVLIDLNTYLNPALFKSFQLLLTGATNVFRLSDFSLNFEARPEQRTFLRVLPNNFETYALKRLTDFATIIDTQSQNVTLTPYLDNVAQTPLIINTAYKATTEYFWTALTLGYDLELRYQATTLTPFEFYGVIHSEKLIKYPQQNKFYQIPNTNFGLPTKKRVRTWPFVVDPKGGTLTFTPIVDGVSLTAINFTGAGKQTIYVFYKTDVFGIDFTGNFSSGTPFEIWEIGKPEIVQALPVPKQFDQVGPEELMRYGKVRQFEVRLIPFGGTTIPYTLYFQDNQLVNGNLIAVDSVEDTYPILIPKTTAGEVIRLVLGPTNFNFHRYYTRIQVVRSGRDSDMEWIILGQDNGSN
jgi:hypothetical protein